MMTTVNSRSTEISTLDALWALYQSQTKKVRQALAKRILAEQSNQRELAQTLPSHERCGRSQHKLHQTQAQQQMVRKSLTRAFDELHAGKVRHDARKLFK